MKKITILIVAFVLIINNSLFAKECKTIKTIFFDLGDTLIESNGQGQFVLRSDASQLIELLKLQDFQLGIITNVSPNWDLQDLESILVDPSFLDDFEVVILSSLAPASKPDPAIFNYAYSQLINPAPITQTAFVTETLSHIGNSIANPTLGARATGMIGIHLSDLPPSSYTDYTIPSNNLLEIDTIINSLIFCNGFE